MGVGVVVGGMGVSVIVIVGEGGMGVSVIVIVGEGGGGVAVIVALGEGGTDVAVGSLFPQPASKASTITTPATSLP
jgi:hypothetical protein